MSNAVQHLAGLAKKSAINCDEQHEYMAFADHKGWMPHKWVIDAMAWEQR